MSSLWLGENSGLFGTLVILWLPTILFYSGLLLIGGSAETMGGAAVSVLTLIYLSFSVVLITITVAMTILMESAKTAARTDKLAYISQGFVGTHSGLLGNLFLLWAPFLFILLVSGPLRKLAPYQADIAAAAENFSGRVQHKANSVASLFAARKSTPYSL